MKKYPNILFLMSDEHRFDVSGFMGNSIVRTPNLDKLAQDAVVFDNAYSPNPICVPARQCLAMGEYASQCGCIAYGQDLPPQSRTFARLFTETGYTTIASGKLHHQGMDQMQGWQIRVAGDCNIERHFFGVENPPALCKHPPFKWSESKEIKNAGPGDSAYLRRDRLAVQGLKDMIYEQFVDSAYDRAVFEQPTMLYLGLLNPHYPYIAEEKLFNYYLNRVEPYENTEEFNHYYLEKCPNEIGSVKIGEQVSEREVKRAMAAYYANIETIDRQYGEILTELQNAGHNLDNWIIIYASDHGEMLGEHSQWEKKKFFEGSVRVPLFIRYPKRFKPQRIKENVNLVDIFETLCELCNIEHPKSLASRSLIPLMENEKDNWCNETFSELLDNLMIKKDNLKYHCYPDSSEILFDLETNPEETINFIDDEYYSKEIDYFRKRASEFRSLVKEKKPLY